MGQLIDKKKQFEIKKVLWITLGLNLFVATIKFVAGDVFNYISLSTSGLESYFDGSSNVLGLMAIHYAFQPADEKHHYGHYKYETLGSLIIALLLIFSAFHIGTDVYAVFSSDGVEAKFGIVPVLTIIISMGVSYFVSWYEGRKAKELGSSLLEADSDHTFGDFIISGGVLLSIILSSFGLTWPDIVVGIAICIYLVYLAFKIVKINLPELLDATPGVTKEILEEIDLMPEVLDMHKFRARGNENFLYIDFHILLEGGLTLFQAHNISHELEENIKKILVGKINHVDITIHMEPYESEHHD